MTPFFFLARFGMITVVAGLGFELRSVAGAVVGGVNIWTPPGPARGSRSGDRGDAGRR